MWWLTLMYSHVILNIIMSSHPKSQVYSSIPPPPPPFLLENCCTILDLCLKSEIMDGFWSSRYLNDRIDLPNKIESFLSGKPTSMVIKMEVKKLLRVFLTVLNVLNMSHGNGCSAFVSQHRWKFLPVTCFTDPGLRFSHTKLVGCHSLYWSNFDF